MIKIIGILFLIFCVFSAFSQVNISPNILGDPFQGQHFKIKAENDVEGSPLLFDEWKSGKVLLTNGETFNIEKLNLDASKGLFVYLKTDTVYELSDNVKEIKIPNIIGEDSGILMVFKCNLLPDQQSSFVQVIIQGTITICKEFSKKPEGENYSNGVVNNTRKYSLQVKEIAIKNKKVINLTFNASSLKELTSDKENQIDSYIKFNKLKVKKEIDFLKSIEFYNTIAN